MVKVSLETAFELPRGLLRYVHGKRRVVTQHSTSHFRMRWGRKSFISSSKNNNHDIQLVITWLDACLEHEKLVFLTAFGTTEVLLLFLRFQSKFRRTRLKNIPPLYLYAIN